MNTETQKSFQNFLDTELNTQQRDAVINPSGPFLVIAGAGSGKTRVITARIAHLILNHDVLPSSIIALTFTNKAAREMKERISSFLGENSNELFVGTFHSYCVRLLKRYNNLLEHPFNSILDEDDKKTILKGIIERNGLKKQINAKQLAYAISSAKNRLTEDSHPDFAQEMPFMHEAFMAYEHEKRLSHALDFDDLLITTLRLFRKNPEFKLHYQQRISHVLVDEYQDTNVVQHELLKQLTLKTDNNLAVDSVCAVGDEDQSIYSWRGATIDNIRNYTSDFANTDIIRIEQNYRSVNDILQVANAVIENNSQRTPKKLWSERYGTQRIHVLSCQSDQYEAETIATCVKEHKRKYPNQSVAILYRTHFQSRSIEEALIKQAVSYKIFGGIQFYERKEVKDILAYARLLVNPHDRASLSRIINTPKRGLGPKFEEQMHAHWAEEPFARCTELFQMLIDSGVATGKKAEALQTLSYILSYDYASDAPDKILQKLISTTRYEWYLKDTDDKEDANNRIDNLKELLRAAEHFSLRNPDAGLREFLDEVSLMQSYAQDQEEQNTVLLMTLHAAKGLEFDLVVLPGLEETLLPSARSVDSADAVEEERRLFYVGITRAKERLLLSHSKFRYSFGSISEQRPSRFLYEVPPTLVPTANASYWSKADSKTFFLQWTSGTLVTEEQNYRKKRSQSKPQTTRVAQKTRSAWQRGATIKHASFGMGTIQKIEDSDPTKTYLTVMFKVGLKKIDSRFITKV